jgi:hypothetical protein
MPEGVNNDYYWHYQTDRVFGLSNSYSLQIRWPGYSSSKSPARRVIVIVALAEELLLMLVISLLGVSVSAATSLKPNS